MNEQPQAKKPEKRAKIVATITVIQDAEGQIKISMFPDDKAMLKEMLYNAFADMDFKEVVFDATIRETNEILRQRGITPEDIDGTPMGIIIDPKGKVH